MEKMAVMYMGCAFQIFKAIIMTVNIGLLNFQPTTENEVNLFFSARAVLFLMLIMDYINVILNNKGGERVIGIIGVGVSILFFSVEISAMGKLIILTENNSVIQGNPSNMIMSFLIPKIKLTTYVLISYGAVISMIGIEGINYASRYGFKEKKLKVGDESVS